MSNNFKLCPRIDTKLVYYPKLAKYITNSVEIQLDKNSHEEDLVNLVKLLGVNTVIFNPSSEAYDICEIIKSKEQQELLVKQLTQVKRLLNKSYNVRFLLHCGWTRYDVTNEHIIACLTKLYNRFKVPFLLMNTNKLGEYDRAIKIVNSMSKPHVSLCLDIANLRAIENQGIDYKKYFNKVNNCKHIHMSYTSCGDGYQNPCTNGVTHPNNETLLADLKLLEEFKLLNRTLCPSVSEVGLMTHTREQEVKEITRLIETSAVAS